MLAVSVGLINNTKAIMFIRYGSEYGAGVWRGTVIKFLIYLGQFKQCIFYLYVAVCEVFLFCCGLYVAVCTVSILS